MRRKLQGQRSAVRFYRLMACIFPLVDNDFPNADRKRLGVQEPTVRSGTHELPRLLPRDLPRICKDNGGYLFMLCTKNNQVLVAGVPFFTSQSESIKNI